MEAPTFLSSSPLLSAVFDLFNWPVHMMQMASPFCNAVLVKETKQPDEGDLVSFCPDT